MHRRYTIYSSDTTTCNEFKYLARIYIAVSKTSIATTKAQDLTTRQPHEPDRYTRKFVRRMVVAGFTQAEVAERTLELHAHKISHETFAQDYMGFIDALEEDILAYAYALAEAEVPK